MKKNGEVYEKNGEVYEMCQGLVKGWQSKFEKKKKKRKG